MTFPAHRNHPPNTGPEGTPPPSREASHAPGSVLTAPVDREWSRSYIIEPASLRRVRTDARMRLTLLRWPGDIATATEVLSRLAHNALRHTQPTHEAPAQMTVRLAVTEDDELVIDVQDPRPDIPLSEAAIAGEKGTGLEYVRLLGARVNCFLSSDMRFKTVRAQLLPDR